MLKLMKGNEENLEGRVIVYSKLKDTGITDSSSVSTPFGMICGQIFAVYVATDPTDFAKKMHITEKKLEMLTDQIKQEQGDFFKEEEYRTERVIRAYGTFIPVRSETELLSGAEDVVYVGEYFDKSLGVMAIRAGVEFYLAKFVDQIKAPLELKDSPFKVDWPIVEKTHKDIETAETGRYIIQEYISPMMHALSCGDNKKLGEIIREFISFGRGSGFLPQIFKLCTAIKEKGEGINKSVIEDYVNKIVAIRKEET